MFTAFVPDPESAHVNKFEMVLNDYHIFDDKNPDAFKITFGNNVYTFRRMNWENNTYWEITLPARLGFLDFHSVVTSDQWQKLRELYPVTFSRGKDSSIHFS